MKHDNNHYRGTVVLSTAEAEALRRDVDTFGEVAVARRMGLSRLSLARCVALLPLYPGTAALARAYLASDCEAA